MNAYEDGREAFRNGENESSIPRWADETYRREWNQGWDDAQHDLYA